MASIPGFYELESVPLVRNPLYEYKPSITYMLNETEFVDPHISLSCDGSPRTKALFKLIRECGNDAYISSDLLYVYTFHGATAVPVRDYPVLEQKCKAYLAQQAAAKVIDDAIRAREAEERRQAAAEAELEARIEHIRKMNSRHPSNRNKTKRRYISTPR